RVGGAAQTKIIKKLGGGVRLALAQYRELAAFSQFASDLDEQTRKQLERGQRITELMKQAQYTPLSVAEMAISLFAGHQAYLDDRTLETDTDLQLALRAHMNANHEDLIHRINESGAWNDELEAELTRALDEFKKTGSW